MADRLYLLELMVHNINFYNNAIKLDKKFLSALGPVVVSIRFRNYPPFELYEDEFLPQEKEIVSECKIKFTSGKSVLFAMRTPTEEVIDCNYRFVVFSVSRKVRSCTENFPLGRAVIELPKGFLKQGASGPSCEVLKDTYCLQDPCGDTVGTISFLIRLSCFGKVIMTQFAMKNFEDRDYVFKGDVRPECPASRQPSYNYGNSPGWGYPDGPYSQWPMPFAGFQGPSFQVLQGNQYQNMTPNMMPVNYNYPSPYQGYGQTCGMQVMQQGYQQPQNAGMMPSFPQLPPQPIPQRHVHYQQLTSNQQFSQQFPQQYPQQFLQQNPQQFLQQYPQPFPQQYPQQFPQQFPQQYPQQSPQQCPPPPRFPCCPQNGPVPSSQAFVDIPRRMC